MDTIDSIHRHRLALLIKEHGTQAALSKVIGKSPAQISQWLNASPDSKTGKPRTMDRTTARAIEKACKKAEGWMDQPIGADKGPAANEPNLFEKLTQEEHDMLDDIRVLIDEDREEVRAMIAERARRARAYQQQIQDKLGLPLVAKSAAERRSQRATLDVIPGDRLKQRSLLDE